MDDLGGKPTIFGNTPNQFPPLIVGFSWTNHGSQARLKNQVMCRIPVFGGNSLKEDDFSKSHFCLYENHEKIPGTSTLSLHGQGCSVLFSSHEFCWCITRKSEVFFSLLDHDANDDDLACFGCHTCCWLLDQLWSQFGCPKKVWPVARWEA